jgi:dUTPase
LLVKFTVTQEFKEKVKIDLKDYQPAYEGTSIGLDLYCIKDLVVPPLLTTEAYREVFRDQWEFETTRTLIPTGIKIALPPNSQGLILERGSIRKTPLKVRAGVVDPGYKGELFINCINLSDRPYPFAAGEKTCFQLVCTPTLPLQLVSDSEYQALTKDSLRGEACLGSSN